MFVTQPKGFDDPLHPDHVYKLKKTIYDLKQALRAWYERLTKYLLKGGYNRGGAYRTLFIRRSPREVIVVQIYVDDIVFGSTSQRLVEEFVAHMSTEFEMSLVREFCIFPRSASTINQLGDLHLTCKLC